MAPADYAALGLYLAAMVGLGVALRGQKSLKEFFLGGNRIPWWAAAFSGIATMMSAVGYLGAPGQAYGGDWTYLQMRVAAPGVLLIACFVVLPFFYKLQVYTAYEYLERRFDRRTRLITASLFVLLKLFYAGVAIYAPALIVAEMTQLPFWTIVVGIGLLTTAYTAAGGIRAVIWTDSVQLFVLLGGMTAGLWFVLGEVDGGFDAVVRTASEAGKLRFFDWSTDLTTEFTVWGSLIGGSFYLLSLYVADQSEVQRFLTTPSLSGSRWALGSSLVVNMVYGVVLFFIGTALWVVHQQQPPAEAVAADQAFPRFILEAFPAGWKGLLVAGVFAAAMSTLSSIFNSLATVSLRDFYQPLTGREGSVRMARAATVAFGLAATAVSLYADSFGQVLVGAGKIRNFFGGSLAGVFLLGILVPRATARGAFWGLLAGFAAVSVVGTYSDASWMWHSAVAGCVTIGAGWLVSLSDPAPHAASLRGLVWRRLLPPPPVTLYTRPGCGLCEEMKRKLESEGRQVEEVNIDLDPELKRLYGRKIPVVIEQAPPERRP